MTIEIVDFPIKNGDFPIKNDDFPIKNGGSFHRFLYVYQRVAHSMSPHDDLPP